MAGSEHAARNLHRVSLPIAAMKFAVYGAGAIGAFTGLVLARPPNEVLLVGRQKLLDEAAAAGGFTAGRKTGDVKIPLLDVKLATDAKSIADFGPDVVLMAVKSDGTRSACSDLNDAYAGRPADRKTTVVSLQNGTSNPAVMREVLDPARFAVLGGMVGFNAIVLPGATFTETTPAKIVVEDLPTGGATAAEIVKAMQEAGIEAAAEPPAEFASIVYGKLVTNLGNAVNALGSVPIVSMLSDRSFRRVLAQTQREALAVLAAHGITPRSGMGRLPAWLAPMVLELPDAVSRVLMGPQLRFHPEAVSSMLDDMRQGRMTEVGHLTGRIVEMAGEVEPKVPVPFNALCLRLVREWEATDRKKVPRIPGPELWRMGVEEARKQGIELEGWRPGVGTLAVTATAAGAAYLAWKVARR
ncbi:ketopantoate reductase PanE/ApbA C terminal-domain-containing protein [Hyaloraphidium curvatum]|nr:ketopantoate reductase PanE/ApbA C terminal-domain-containing protein [Hyaloraphidium curvatum]